MGEIQHDRQGAQRAEDAADAEGVGDRLTQTIPLGNLEIGDGAGVIAADLDGVDHIGRRFQRLAPVRHTEMGGDRGAPLVDVGVEAVEHLLRFAQADGVGVVQGEVGVVERLAEHSIAENILSKNGASGTHKRDFWHGRVSFELCATDRKSLFRRQARDVRMRPEPATRMGTMCLMCFSL